MKKIKVKKENSTATYLEVACVHLMGNLKPITVHEIVIEDQSTFMCPKCYKDNKMAKDIENGLIDDWFSVCRHCLEHKFKDSKIEVEIIN